MFRKGNFLVSFNTFNIKSILSLVHKHVKILITLAPHKTQYILCSHICKKKKQLTA